MRTWRPESWSQQARNMSDGVIRNVNNGYWSIDEAVRFFQVSYRHPLIRMRAAKRFGYYLKHGKIHESAEAVMNFKEQESSPIPIITNRR